MIFISVHRRRCAGQPRLALITLRGEEREMLGGGGEGEEGWIGEGRERIGEERRIGEWEDDGGKGEGRREDM